MGADLYIDLVFKPSFDKWEGKFNEAAAQRDACEKGTEEYKHWQGKTWEYYDLMYADGYFRDSYNPSNLLWKFGLSWWEDILPMVDEEQNLSVDKAGEFLEMLASRQETFKKSLAELPDEEQYEYQQRYSELQKFLNRAIELESPVNCSL